MTYADRPVPGTEVAAPGGCRPQTPAVGLNGLVLKRRTGWFSHRQAGVAAVALLATLLAGCATPSRPTVQLGPTDTLKAAQQLLTERCLDERGLVAPRPGRRGAAAGGDEQRRVDRALFGAGRAELSLKLPGGTVISQHTDGCLAAAQQRLYGDQRRWFHASTTVNNLKSRAPKAERDTYRELRARGLVRARALLTAEQNEQQQKGNPV